MSKKDFRFSVAHPLAQPTFETVFEDFAAFSKRTFVKSTPATSLVHLRREIDEVEDELNSGYHPDFPGIELITEFSDCFLCLISAATRAGITAKQLVEAMDMKAIKNKGRTWMNNGDGTYSHVTPEKLAKMLMKEIMYDSGEVNRFEDEEYPEQYVSLIADAAGPFFYTHKNLLLEDAAKDHINNITCGERSEVEAVYGHLFGFEVLDEALEKYFNRQ